MNMNNGTARVAPQILGFLSQALILSVHRASVSFVRRNHALSELRVCLRVCLHFNTLLHGKRIVRAAAIYVALTIPCWR